MLIAIVIIFKLKIISLFGDFLNLFLNMLTKTTLNQPRPIYLDQIFPSDSNLKAIPIFFVCPFQVEQFKLEFKNNNNLRDVLSVDQIEKKK